MKLQEIKDMNNLVVVCGNISSGKGHYSQQYFPDYHHIAVSSIVKKLSGFNKRSELGTTADLGNEIVRELNKEIAKYDKVVVDGVRQPDILKALVANYGLQHDNIIWLDVPEETLRARFAKRAAKKDDMSFDKSLESDRELGIGDVEAYIRKHGRVVPY